MALTRALTLTLDRSNPDPDSTLAQRTPGCSSSLGSTVALTRGLTLTLDGSNPDPEAPLRSAAL